MTNHLVLNQAAIPAALRGLAANNQDLREGLVESFPVLSIRGGRFRINYQGQEFALRTPDGNFVSVLDVVMVRVAGHVSKIFYPGAYQEGDDNPPTCWSVDGTTPDPGVNPSNRQSMTCAACPQNVWGSKTTPQGNQTKACSDSRRLAVVPAGDILNAAYGGPLLLRVPAASLKNLAAYGSELDRVGVPYAAVITRISFDANSAYPLLTFQAVGMLDEGRAVQLMEVLQLPQVGRMLSTPQAALPAPAALPQPTTIAQPFAAPQPQQVVPQGHGVQGQVPMQTFSPPPVPVAPTAPVVAAPIVTTAPVVTAPAMAPTPPPASSAPSTAPPQPVWNEATGQWELPGQAPPPPQPAPRAAARRGRPPRASVDAAMPQTITVQPEPQAQPTEQRSEVVTGAPLGNALDLQAAPQPLNDLVKSILN